MNCKSTIMLGAGVAALLLSSLACGRSPSDSATAAGAPGTDEPALQEVFGDAFMIGSAVNDDQASGHDADGAELVQRHFNTITAENVLKWEVVHPEPGRFDFDAGDRFVDFGNENDMFVVGHTLVWHSQTPEWVFEDEQGNPLTRDALLERMRDHIHTVAGRYRGRVDGWDVVNEALNEDGTLRESPWYRIIGEDYIAKAFEYAHEADPDAELYYNDFSLENEPKRNGALRLVQRLLEQGVPVHGLGSQLHAIMDWPSKERLDSTITAFSALGLDVMYTEVDVDMLPRDFEYHGADISVDMELRAELNPYEEGLPEEQQQALAERYADIFEVFMRHRDVISRVTFWGVTDGDSWLNYWPVEGRTNYPLLFDREHEPKPAFHAVVETAQTDLIDLE